MAASAGYWLASAADEIVAANTAELGSIGVVFSMRRRPGDSLEIVSTSSPKKRPDPGTDEGRRQIQQRADAIAEVFIEAIQINRSLSRERVLALEGDVAIASRAIELGLADRLGSLESVIAELQQKPNYGGKAMPITYEQLRDEAVELFEQVKEEGRAEARQEAEEQVTQAKVEGRDNVVGLIEAVFGEEAKATLEQVLETGMTAEQVKAAKNLFASPEEGKDSKGVKAQILEGIEAAHGEGVAPAGEGESEPKDFEAAVQAYQKEHDCSKAEAMKAVAKEKPELYEAYHANKFSK
jgi:ClpP class serine protease